MITVTHKPFIELGGRTVPLNVAEHSGCIIEAVAAGQQALDAMLSHHSDVFVVYLVVQLDKYTPDNKPISRFMRSVSNRLLSNPKRKSRKRFKFEHFGYLWTREIETAVAQHYHVALMLNGKQIKHPLYLLREYLKPAADQCGLKVSLCDGFHRVLSSDEDSYGVCMKRMSYSAKERGKGARKEKAKRFGHGFRSATSESEGQPSEQPVTTAPTPAATEAQHVEAETSTLAEVFAVSKSCAGKGAGEATRSVIGRTRSTKAITCGKATPKRISVGVATVRVGSSRGPPESSQ